MLYIFLFQDAHLHLLQNNNNSTLDISITRSMKLQSIVVINIVYFLLLVILLVVVVHNRWSQRPLSNNLDVVQLFTPDLEVPALGIVYQMLSKLPRTIIEEELVAIMEILNIWMTMIIIPIITIIIVIDDIILLTVTISIKESTMEVIMRTKNVIWCPSAAEVRPPRVVQFLPSQKSHPRDRPNLHP